MSNDSVIVLRGALNIIGQQSNHQSEQLLYDRTQVKLIVYKTSNGRFAVVYPSAPGVAFETNRPHICCLNLKSCTVDVVPGVSAHSIYINTNSDFDCLQLVLTVEANNYNVNDLYVDLRCDYNNQNKPFEPMTKRVSVSRQTSLEKVDEVD